MNFHTQRHFFVAARFFGLMMGHYQGVFYIFCSVNKTLKTLLLNENCIGDAGAGSIGVALTYFIFFPF
jgi:hypothetical protein